MSPLAGKGNGTSRPTLTPGARQHTTTGLQRGQEAGGTASTSECFTSLPSTLLFPSLQLSSKNICLLFLRHPPLTSVLASPWPILSIVVDVMTKNKQCEGVRLPFVWAGRSPSPLRTGRISPDERGHFLLLLLTGTWTPSSASAADQMWSRRTHFVFPAFKLIPPSPRCCHSLNDLSRKKFNSSWQATWYTPRGCGLSCFCSLTAIYIARP